MPTSDPSPRLAETRPPATDTAASLDEGRPPSAGPSHRHRHRYRIARERRQRIGLPFLLLTLIGIVSLGLVVSLVQLSTEEAARVGRRDAAEQLAAEIQTLRAEGERLEARLDALVRARSPNLRPVLAEQVIAIDEGLVKNILFTQSGTEREKALEYRAALRNGGTGPVRPRLRLLFFNRVGLQIGESAIGAGESGAPVLNGGESAAFSGKTLADPEYGLPVYFMIADRP